MGKSTTVKVKKEHFTSTAKAKEHAANLRKGGIKARVERTLQNKKK
jgi:hypothetical protein